MTIACPRCGATVGAIYADHDLHTVEHDGCAGGSRTPWEPRRGDDNAEGDYFCNVHSVAFNLFDGLMCFECSEHPRLPDDVDPDQLHWVDGGNCLTSNCPLPRPHNVRRCTAHRSTFHAGRACGQCLDGDEPVQHDNDVVQCRDTEVMEMKS